MKALFFALGFVILATQKSWGGRGEAINIYIENDTRDIGGPGSDNAYSNGFKISYVTAEDDIPKWSRPLIEKTEWLQSALKKSQSNLGISLGQQIYTPNDIRRADLITDDRPYAAWLYVGISAQFKNPNRSHALELDLGVIGPEALGESIQNGYHKIIAKYPAEGWRHQLATEPTVQLSYQQRMRFIEFANSNNKYFDAIPFFGAGLGNVAVDAHVGGMIRAGHNLPDDFGPTRPSMSDGDNFVTPITDGFPTTSLYVFAAGRGIAVARNIFLDGNTFRESHKVTKYPFVLETEVGVVGIHRQWTAAWRFVTRSPEFEQRSVVNSFASISIGYSF